MAVQRVGIRGTSGHGFWGRSAVADCNRTTRASAPQFLTICSCYCCGARWRWVLRRDRKSTRLNSSHDQISYAVFCLKKKKKKYNRLETHHTLFTAMAAVVR